MSSLKKERYTGESAVGSFDCTDPGCIDASLNYAGKIARERERKRLVWMGTPPSALMWEDLSPLPWSEHQRYRRLTDPQKCTRLLRLLPGTGREALYGELVECDIVRCPNYEALSYRWQDSGGWDVDRQISSGRLSRGCGFRVIQDCREPHIHIPGGYGIHKLGWSLLEALYVFRLPHQPRLLWIDQICIDQRSERGTDQTRSEKEEQVMIMGNIYCNAMQTLVWLGVEEEIDASTLAIIQSCGSLLDELEGHLNDIISERDADSTLRHVYNGLSSSHSPKKAKVLFLTGLANLPDEQLGRLGVISRFSTTINQDQVRDVVAFFQKSYFRRTWPIQEVVLSKMKIAHCGRHLSIEWKYLGFFAGLFMHKGEAPDISRSEFAGVEAAFYAYWYALNYDDGFPLVPLLRATRRFDCGDPRDKIFALGNMVDYSLSSNNRFGNNVPGGFAVPRELEPDYSTALTEADLNRKLAMYLMSRDQCLEILSFVQHNEDANASTFAERPSWVPFFWKQPEVAAPMWLSDLNSTTELDNHTACTIPDPQVAFDRLLSSASGADRRPFSCTVHGIPLKHGRIKRMGGPLREASLWPRGIGAQPLLTHVLASIDMVCQETVQKKRAGIFPRSIDAEFVTALAMVLTAGRTKPAKIVRRAKKSDNDASEEQHVADFRNFVLGQAMEQSNRTSIAPLVGFLKVVDYLKHTPGRFEGNGQAYKDMLLECCRNRRVFCTDSGLLGLGPLASKVGDHVYVFKGGLVPLLVRRHREGSTGWLIGECYVYGVMEREVEGIVERSAQPFTLV